MINIKIPPRIRLINTPAPASRIAEPKRINIEPPIPHPIPYKIPVNNPTVLVGGICFCSFSVNFIV